MLGRPLLLGFLPVTLDQAILLEERVLDPVVGDSEPIVVSLEDVVAPRGLVPRLLLILSALRLKRHHRIGCHEDADQLRHHPFDSVDDLTRHDLGAAFLLVAILLLPVVLQRIGPLLRDRAIYVADRRQDLVADDGFNFVGRQSFAWRVTPSHSASPPSARRLPWCTSIPA